MFTRQEIPANRDHIPMPDMAKQFSHLEQVAENLSFLQDCERDLLIAYDCPKAVIPREVIASTSMENYPYGPKTDLG